MSASTCVLSDELLRRGLSIRNLSIFQLDRLEWSFKIAASVLARLHMTFG